MAKDFEMGYLLDFYGEVLTPKQREMLNQYYNDDLSLSEIGENFGITRQGARDARAHCARLGIPFDTEAADAYAQAWRQG